MAREAVTAFVWLVVLWRLPTLRQDRWRRTPSIALAALAVSLTMSLPRAGALLTRAAGVPGIAVLAEHLTAILACAAVLDWIAALPGPGPGRAAGRRPRARHLATAAAITAMAVLFAVMPAPATAEGLTATATGGPAAAYLMIFFAYVAAAMTITTAAFWRSARAAPRGAVRAGMLLLTAGTTLAACYAADRIAFLTTRALGGLATAGARTAAVSTGIRLENTAIALILAGMSLPALGVGLQSALDLNALRELRPLWRLLAAAVPAIDAGLPRHGPGPLRCPRVALIRRAAEIRDAALALRYAVPPRTLDAARGKLKAKGITGENLATATEACWLALAARRQTAAGGNATAHVLPGGATLDDEVRLLRQIAAAARSRAVRAVVAELDGQPPRRRPHPLRTTAARNLRECPFILRNAKYRRHHGLRAVSGDRRCLGLHLHQPRVRGRRTGC